MVFDMIVLMLVPWTWVTFQNVLITGSLCEPESGGTRSFHLGAVAHRSGEWGPGAKPSKGPGGLCHPEGEAVCRHCLQILIAETIKM